MAPGAWVRAAARAGHAALALADHESLAHAVTFYRAARAEGVRPVLGLELARPGCTALLLARDRDGYARLCELATAAALGGGDRPGAGGDGRAGGGSGAGGAGGGAGPAWDAAADLERDARGLFALTDDGPTLRRLAGLPRGVLFTRLRAGRSAPQPAERAARLSLASGRPLVATGEALYLESGQREVRRALHAAREKQLAARIPLEAAAPEHARLWSAPEAAREFERFPGALRRGAALADACRVELQLGRPIFPQVEPPGGGDALGYLRARCEAGLRARYSPGRLAAARARLRHELAQADALGFTPYFLLVAEVMAFARAAGIPSVGRGSGASSILAYALGITNVDPLAQRLCFERFLHPERPDCPDLDIDLCWKRRDEVVEHVLGAHPGRSAMIGTQAAFGFRSAFREVAKALGVGPADVTRLAARLPRELGIGPGGDLCAALAAHPPARGVDWDEPELARALRLALHLEGHLHHLGMHPGGVVIADRALTRYLALARSAKGVTITQCEMHAVEALGLVKLDLLGNRALTEIGEAVAAAGPPGAGAADAPDRDPATVALLQSGRTLSCFQLESPAMRHLLRQLRPQDLADTIAAVALIRPGPAESGMKERFVRRRLGLEPVTVMHPWLRGALEPTQGLLLYEEDVMTVAATMLGQPLADGDLVRRAIQATRSEAERAALGGTFVARCVSRGVEEPAARAVWAALARFAAYAFCKAHAAGYGALAWHTAYLKAHHPAEFYCAVANHHQGMYPLWVHLEEARQAGVEVRGPHVNASEDAFTLEGRAAAALPSSGGPGAGAAGSGRESAGAWPAPTARRAVRAGLSCVTALTEASRARLIRERSEGGPFTSLPDFLARARLPERECAALVDAGALDFTARSRAALRFELSATHSAYRGATPGGWFPGHRAPCPLPELPEFPLAERLRRESAAAGFTVSAPPLAPWAEALAGLRPVPAARLPESVGRAVRVAGIPCAARRVRTKSGRTMFFLTLADATGLAECTFFPDTYAASPPPSDAGPLVVEGRAEEQLGAVTVAAARWAALGRPGPAVRGGAA